MKDNIECWSISIDEFNQLIQKSLNTLGKTLKTNLSNLLNEKGIKAIDIVGNLKSCACGSETEFKIMDFTPNNKSRDNFIETLEIEIFYELNKITTIENYPKAHKSNKTDFMDFMMKMMRDLM
jgi:hypothetical protein